MSTALLTLLRLVPRNLVSRLAGRLASVRLPRPLRGLVLGAFGRTFGIDFTEVVGSLDEYASVQEFFTRPLPPGARAVDPAPDAVVAPCDGLWGTAGVISDGLLLQVKGRPYSVAALLGGAGAAATFDGGVYATFYLAPRNYHRFHAPCAVRVERAVHIPGTLWPVNRIGLEGVPGLFAQNERICAFMRAGGGSLCLVAVGATMVGKVRVNFDDLSTNTGARGPVERSYPGDGPAFDKGAEWGRFEFGSTIVLLASPGLLELDRRPPGTEMRLGTRIGTLTAAVEVPAAPPPPAPSDQRRDRRER